MHWNRGRALAVGGLVAGTAAALVSVLAALSAPASGVRGAHATQSSRTVSFGHARVALEALPYDTLCYRVTEPTGSSRSCRTKLRADEIGFTVTPRGIGGAAGAEVRAVIVKLTRRGTVWSTLRDGVFYADVPPAYRVRSVVMVLRDGTRTAFAVRRSP
jgi:hypothetical protein